MYEPAMEVIEFRVRQGPWTVARRPQGALDGTQDCFRVVAFGDHVKNATSFGEKPRRFRVVAVRTKHDARVGDGRLAANGASQLKAIHSGQQNASEEQVRPLGSEQLHSLEAVARCGHLIAGGW